MQIILLMDANQVNIHTAKSFIEFMTAVLRKFSTIGLHKDSLTSFVHPYFVNFSNVTHQQDFEDQLRSIMKIFQDKVTIINEVYEVEKAA